jgi:hypothetical protein
MAAGTGANTAHTPIRPPMGETPTPHLTTKWVERENDTLGKKMLDNECEELPMQGQVGCISNAAWHCANLSGGG